MCKMASCFIDTRRRQFACQILVHTINNKFIVNPPNTVGDETRGPSCVRFCQEHLKTCFGWSVSPKDPNILQTWSRHTSFKILFSVTVILQCSQEMADTYLSRVPISHNLFFNIVIAIPCNMCFFSFFIHVYTISIFFSYSKLNYIVLTVHNRIPNQLNRTWLTFYFFESGNVFVKHPVVHDRNIRPTCQWRLLSQ
jgi:hypothetical protein